MNHEATGPNKHINTVFLSLRDQYNGEQLHVNREWEERENCSLLPPKNKTLMRVDYGSEPPVTSC